MQYVFSCIQVSVGGGGEEGLVGGGGGIALAPPAGYGPVCIQIHTL